jgi:ATP-dependent Clp protease ATP-binding subunit ClpB
MQLANTLFDSPEAMIRIDASEYAERHSIARLVRHVYSGRDC